MRQTCVAASSLAVFTSNILMLGTRRHSCDLLFAYLVLFFVATCAPTSIYPLLPPCQARIQRPISRTILATPSVAHDTPPPTVTLLAGPNSPSNSTHLPALPPPFFVHHHCRPASHCAGNPCHRTHPCAFCCEHAQRLPCLSTQHAIQKNAE